MAIQAGVVGGGFVVLLLYEKWQYDFISSQPHRALLSLSALRL